LRHAIAVAHVHKNQAAKVAYTRHPAVQHYVVPNIIGTEQTAINSAFPKTHGKTFGCDKKINIFVLCKTFVQEQKKQASVAQTLLSVLILPKDTQTRVSVLH
jgi:hypothetical protein